MHSSAAGAAEREGPALLPAPGQDVHTVPLSELLPADSPRLAGEDENHTRRLVEAEAELPPILVHRSTMRVIDGMHRLRAAMASGRKEIRVRFFEGDENEAFLHAVRENVTHGLPLSLDDRRRAAQRIIAASPDLSDRAIAGYTGLSDKTVSALRKRSSAENPQSSKRIGVDGRARPLNSTEGRRRAVEFLAARPDASLREIAAGAGISVGTAHDVRKQMQRGEDPIRSRRPSADPDRATSPGPGQVVTARRPARRSAPDVTGFDPGSLLESFVHDPAIRQSESGRGMLRWLHDHVVRGADVNQLIEAVPPHRADCLITLAEHCAGVWRSIADRLAADQTSQSSGRRPTDDPGRPSARREL
ncbi:ParB/RepB/Spo0J family partition protein [Actinoallomurus rhizosphaericola]|uniref:ParB/RepB/Spo0J family partition protein n=1 Tax=Actinoallomurus rhizosphaericola TaxID=2952536 RepID=UPI002091ED49|nr:ParB N-terminal domain-containing protein [Actinoallomurus rhizosphaericola]MCO5998080.1 ParB N-terminal domain-containing protein [Actinoallomurus rhizosphaericola]